MSRRRGARYAMRRRIPFRVFPVEVWVVLIAFAALLIVHPFAGDVILGGCLTGPSGGFDACLP